MIPIIFTARMGRLWAISGWGGSCVFADPVSGLHGAYVMNRQRNSLLGDVRPRTLIDTVYAAL